VTVLQIEWFGEGAMQRRVVAGRAPVHHPREEPQTGLFLADKKLAPETLADVNHIRGRNATRLSTV